MRTLLFVATAFVGVSQSLGAQASPVRSIAAIRRDSAALLAAAQPVSIAGRVTLGTRTVDSTRLVVFVQDSTGGMQLFARTIVREAHVGDSIVATGVPKPYRGLLELSDASFVVIPGRSRFVGARSIALEPEALAGVAGRLVRVAGRVTDARVVRGATQITLQRHDRPDGVPASVVVIAPMSGEVALDRFARGDKIDVAGVLWRRDETDGKPRYVLFPRSSDDVAGQGLTARTRAYLMLSLLVVLPTIGVVLFRIQAARSARRLRLIEARFHALYDEALDAVIVQDAAWQIYEANHAASSLTGVSMEALRQRSLLDFFSDEGRAALADSVAELQTRGHLEREARLKRPDGQFADVTLRLTIIPTGRQRRILTVIRDVSASRQLEEQLRQAHKMEAVGQLAGGVAHDFNNLLTVIGMHCEFLADHVAGDDTALQDVEAIRDAANRAADLTRQLLAFSRKQMLQPELLDINAAIVDVERMLGRLIGEDITLALELQPGVGYVEGDRGQIGQVLMNLAVNARDAMPDGGRLTIATRRVDRRDFTSDDELPDGPYVELTVRDTGVGMSGDVRERIFEPFFTTKEQGKGTGLGLATTYGIIRQSGGHVSVDSALGAGTTFFVYLPLRSQSAATGTAAESTVETVGSETVLLVEDEEHVRALARRVLERDGYVVLSAASGMEALRLVENYRGPIDILVTDIVMPGLNGRELHARLDAMLGGLRVLFVSGYNDDEFIRRGLRRQDLPYLQKPFGADQLAVAVREVLDGVWSARASRPSSPPSLNVSPASSSRLDGSACR